MVDLQIEKHANIPRIFKARQEYTSIGHQKIQPERQAGCVLPVNVLIPSPLNEMFKGFSTAESNSSLHPAAAYNPDYKATFELHVKLFAFKSKEAGNTHENQYSCTFSIYSAFDPQL
ncbi:uncharacterized [Tachysurus ichikawai]